MNLSEQIRQDIIELQKTDLLIQLIDGEITEDEYTKKVKFYDELI